MDTIECIFILPFVTVWSIIVPGGGFIMDVLPVFAKNRALPLFFTITTANFGLKHSREQMLIFRKWTHPTGIPAWSLEKYQWFVVIHAQQQQLIDHPKHHLDRVQLIESRKSMKKRRIRRWNYFFPARCYSRDDTLSMNLIEVNSISFVKLISFTSHALLQTIH